MFIFWGKFRSVLLLFGLMILIGVVLYVGWNQLKPASIGSSAAIGVTAEKSNNVDINASSGLARDDLAGISNLQNEALGLGDANENIYKLRGEFLSRWTSDQRSRGVEILQAARIASWQSDQIHFKQSFYKEGSDAISYTLDCRYTSKGQYSEEASGATAYRYVANRDFEITNYYQDLNRAVGIVPRDTDHSVFLEQFPARIGLDKDMVYLGEKTVPDADGKPVRLRVLGTSFYNLYVGDDDTVQGMLFFSRTDRQHQMVRILNVSYDLFNVASRGTQVKLPVGYTMRNNWDNTAYRVTLHYDNSFSDDIPVANFNLTVK